MTPVPAAAAAGAPQGPPTGTTPFARARKWLVPALALGAAGLLIWWALSLDRVTDRTRTQDIDMFDIAEPPPPPPPEEAPQETPPEETPPVEQPSQATPQPDPLTPQAPANTSPPNAAPSNIAPTPSPAASGPFTAGQSGPSGPAGPPGQARPGTGRTVSFGPSPGDARASRAYAESVAAHIRRHVQRNAALRGQSWSFRVSVSITPTGGISVRNVSGITPAELAAAIRGALAGLGNMSSGPPEGRANTVTVEIRST